MNKNILLVDDDRNILQGYKRQLRKQYKIEIAPGGKEGLKAISQKGPFAIIISDMRMPEMDGKQFLAEACKIAPESIRMMLTGNADQKTAMDAVNDGQIFRFLTKPCSPEALTKAIEAGIEQYRLITAEKELLSKTLSGSVSVLTEILSLVNPLAFGHATQVRRLARQICQKIPIENGWEIEIAAMLSQVGCITLPESTLAKLARGEELSEEELRLHQGHPQVGHDLIAKIPRLTGVADIIAYQQKCYDGSGIPEDDIKEAQIPIGSRVIKLVTDAAQLLSVEKSTQYVLGVILDRPGWYDPHLVDALSAIFGKEFIVHSVTIDLLEQGMILDEHVMSLDGDLLIARGQAVTMLMQERLQKFSQTSKGVQEPIRVQRPLPRQNENGALSSELEGIT